MIKAKVTNPVNGRTYFVLGLSDIEIKRLKEGDPLGVIMSELGFDEGPDCVLLVHGATYAEVKERIGGITPHSQGLTLQPKKRRN
jgi:hypothetical protein